MLEAQLDQNRLVAFDGRVLETFAGSVNRYHVDLLTVAARGPDNRDNLTVTFTHTQSENTLSVDQAGFDGLRPILDALQNAGARVVAQ